MTANVTLVGNLTRDPELHFTPSGVPVASFGLAVNRRWQNRQTQEWEERVSFFNITCWRNLAHNVCDTLEKGSRALLSGRLEQRSWEQDGAPRSVVEVIADEVGPSLRWATADLHRNERRSADGDAAQETRSNRPHDDAAKAVADPPVIGEPADEPF